MAASCKRCISFLLLNYPNRLRWKESSRTYAQFSRKRQPPVITKEETAALLNSDNEKILNDILRLPPTNSVTCSVFYDEDKDKFINYLMKCGKREEARILFENVLTAIKHEQLRKFNKEKNEEKKKEIIIDPMEVFRMAVKNTTPLLNVINIKKSGTWYRVPTAVKPNKAKNMAMNWIIKSSIVKYEKVPYKEHLISEILRASKYEGKSVQKKIELHKLCEANRGYAHYKWT